MPRTALGVLALFVLAVSIPWYIWYPSDSSTSKAWIAAAIRIGAMLGAVWVAHPQLKRMSPGVWIVALLIIVIIARFRYVAPFFIVILIALAILRPRRGSGQRN
jgi:4-amino-4-deoxy-L-arabinose transferase-like glycosyltransferase